MAKISIFHIGKANAELNAADEALAPALAKAGINSIAVDGKTLSLAEASLSAKISALISAQPPVTDSSSAAEALVSNELISKELEKVNTELAIKTTAVDGLTRDKAELAEKLGKSEAAVTDLTGKLSTCTIERDSAVNQFNATAKQLSAQKVALAERCISANCLDLNGTDGKPLAKDATHEAKIEAAVKISHEDLFKAYNGAVNAAVAKTGVSFAEIPSGKPAGVGEQKPEVKGRAKFTAALRINGQTKTA